MRGLLCLVAFVALFAYASATHYRYGTIYWQTTGVNTVNFTVETAWRRSYYTPLPNVGSTLTMQSFYYGDGQKYDFPATVVTVNLKEDWVITIASFTHVYASAVGSSGAPWTAYFGGSARISTLQNNHDQPWALTTTVNCNLASSPRSKMLPIANVLLVDSTTATFTVPAVTDDNTQVHYTLANSAQICGKPGCVNPPKLAVDQVSGVVSWDVTSINPGLWTAVIMISTDKVMVPVDFIINYSKVPGKCATNCTKPGIQCILPTDCGQCASGGSCVKPQPPMFIAPTPSNTATYNVAANTPISFNVTAMSPQSGSTVTIQEGTLPVGAGLGPNIGTNPVVRTFTWLPYVDNLGPSIVCFSATDSIALTSAQYCITIDVSNGCIPACGGNSNCVNGKCECATGFFGPNCTTFGGEVYDGQTLYGSVAMHESNYYYFNPVSPTSAIKIVLQTLEANFGTSIYISTTVQQPTITSNTWDEINENPNSIVITPDDPDYIFNATYYVAVEGWYASFDNLVDYNLTIFLS